MANSFNLVFLGTGTSQGVPVIGCECSVCKSSNTKDKRLRTAAMLQIDGKNIVIDTGPDFRQQMLRENVKTVEAVLFTHEHKDHVAGLDDIRSFNFRSGKVMQIYGSTYVETGLKREFHYAFGESRYPGTPQFNLNIIADEPFEVADETITPINVLHYKLPVKAYRIRNFAYVTDANFIAPKEKEKLKNLDCLVLNALRKEKHISHFNLDEALELIAELKPKQAYLTHLSHLMGKHEDVSALLPQNVALAYDGLEIDLNAF